MDISIIVATFNRAQHLGRALTALGAVRVPPAVTCEVIVVDNNSTDGTREVVHALVPDRRIRFRYAVELRQGKSFALNTGINLASGEVLAFTDDDCLVDAGWIETILRVLRRDESLAGIGGRVELYDKRDQAVSIRTESSPYLCSPTRVFSSIIGCNMAFKRRVFDAVGLFDPMFGPGNVAEDVDLLYRALRRGFRVMYSPEMLVRHNHGRRTADDARNVRRQYIGGHGAFHAKHVLHGDVVALRMCFREFKSAFVAVARELPTRRGEQRCQFGWLVRGFLHGISATLGRKEAGR